MATGHIETIANIRKDGTGSIIAVKTDKGNIYPIDEAIQRVKNHLIDGVTVDKDSKGKEILATNPTGLHYGPLDNVPEF